MLAVAGEDGQLSFLEASHPASAAKNRALAFSSLPGSGRPLPLVSSMYTSKSISLIWVCKLCFYHDTWL